MTSDLLAELLHQIDSFSGRFADLHRYASGTQPLAFISPESRKALGNRLCRMASNVPALAVSSLVERLRVQGFSDQRAWELFVANDLDQLSTQAMSDALTFGTGYVLVWAKDGRPVASVESPCECAVLRDPADRSVIAGVKRFERRNLDRTTETHAYVYLPDQVQHYRSDGTGQGVSGYVLVETIEHYLDTVPLVPIDNGRSEIDDIKPLVDALNKLLLDMMVCSEAAGKGRRWVTGMELTERPVLDADGNPILDNGQPVMETVNPVDELSSVAWAVAENAETKFGAFGEANLAGFEAGVRIVLSQIMAVSALPSHYLGILTDQPTSADALRASEASLTARAEQRQLMFGKAWERVGRLLIAVDTGIHPDDIPLRVQWADAATRSVAQEADATVKLYQAGLLPAAYALAKLGYSADEIAAIETARASELSTPPANGSQNAVQAQEVTI